MRTVLALLLCACGPSVAVDDDGDGETSSASSTTDPTSTSAGTTVGTTATTVTTTSATTVSTTDPDSSTSTSSTTDDTDESAETDFIIPPDGSSCFTVCIECDVWAQDCADGEKCMAWANDGGNVWNASRCSPIANEPAAIGDPCIVEGSGVSGIDDCELGAICWGVDDSTNEGTCVPRCTGSEANPECPDGLDCMIAFEGYIIVCLPPCDPLDPACAADEFCSHQPSGAQQFLCQPTPPFQPQPYGAPCDELQLCDAGLVCALANDVPGCASDNCCTQLGATDAPAPCPDATQSCLPLEPPHESLCYCGVP